MWKYSSSWSTRQHLLVCVIVVTCNPCLWLWQSSYQLLVMIKIHVKWWKNQKNRNKTTKPKFCLHYRTIAHIRQNVHSENIKNCTQYQRQVPLSLPVSRYVHGCSPQDLGLKSIRDQFYASCSLSQETRSWSWYLWSLPLWYICSQYRRSFSIERHAH